MQQSFAILLLALLPVDDTEEGVLLASCFKHLFLTVLSSITNYDML